MQSQIEDMIFNGSIASGSLTAICQPQRSAEAFFPVVWGGTVTYYKSSNYIVIGRFLPDVFRLWTLRLRAMGLRVWARNDGIRHPGSVILSLTQDLPIQSDKIKKKI